MLKAVSTMDSYGVVNDGALQNNNGGNNNSGDQPSGGLIPDMHLAFTTEDGAAVYKPVMPPNSPLSAASGIGGDGSALPKRQRGRPKKYPYEGDMSSLPPQPLEASAAYRASGLASPPPTTTKSRGRPVGSGLKQQPQAIMGSPRGELTTHVITVTAGEDVSSKIMSFSENGNRGVWILSANGAISNVTLHKPATSEETVTYQGHFEILSLSGSYMLLEEGGQRSITCGLTVTLAGPDGCVLGGGVAGILTAATPVQVVVGCFIAREVALNSPIQADPLATPAKLLPGASSSETLSESSGGPGSPIDQSPGACKH